MCQKESRREGGIEKKRRVGKRHAHCVLLLIVMGQWREREERRGKGHCDKAEGEE